MLGIVKNWAEHKMPDFIMVCLHSELHFKYGVQVWSPSLEKDIVNVEKMQKKVTGITKVIEHSYEEQVNRLGLWERPWGDRREKCKIKGGLERLNRVLFTGITLAFGSTSSITCWESILDSTPISFPYTARHLLLVAIGDRGRTSGLIWCSHLGVKMSEQTNVSYLTFSISFNPAVHPEVVIFSKLFHLSWYFENYLVRMVVL